MAVISLVFSGTEICASESRALVALTVMMGLEANADFEFHVVSWLKSSTTGLAVRPELERGRPAFAIARPRAQARGSAPAQCHGILRRRLITVA